MKKTFISYSSKDKDFVFKLQAEIVEPWVDFLDLEAGDELISKIEQGIDSAKNFVLVLSANSLKSNWVKLESHMALIKKMEDDNYRIIVVRIDACEVPLRFKPYLHIDCPGKHEKAIEEIKKSINKSADVVYRRRFVNRSVEIGKIENYVNAEEIRLIVLYGIYGIGKTSLVKEAITRLWSSPECVEVHLSKAHVGARLALELAALAGVDLPKENLPEKELNNIALLAVEQIILNKKILIFNNLDNLTDEKGHVHKQMASILSHLASIKSKLPVFLISRRYLVIDGVAREAIGHLKIEGLQTEHMISIMDTEVNKIATRENLKKDCIREISEKLYGYPLAAKMAAPLLVNYTPEYLIQNLRHITELKLDIAESILSNVTLDESLVEVLGLLSVFEGPLSVSVLSVILEKETEQVMSIIDQLANLNIIEVDGIGVKIHPLIKDFYWKAIRLKTDLKEYAAKVADVAKENLAKTKIGTPEYVTWLINSCRFLYLAGKMDEAKGLRSDLIGELRAAAIDLYQGQHYELALTYCNEYLVDHPDDFEINFHKVRCFSRLENFDGALKQLEELMRKYSGDSVYQAKILYAQGRTYFEKYKVGRDIGNLKTAKEAFYLSLQKNTRAQSVYQSLADVLFVERDFDTAEKIIRKALEIAPQNAHALTSLADILWQNNKKEEAMESIESALKSQPHNWNFLFRKGRFKLYENKIQEAYGFFNEALKYKASYHDARLSRARAALELGKLDVTVSDMDILKKEVRGHKKLVLQNIEGRYLLLTNKIDEADRLARYLLGKVEDVPNLVLMSNVELEHYRKNKSQGLSAIAANHKKSALEYVEKALKIDNRDSLAQGLRNKILVA